MELVSHLKAIGGNLRREEADRGRGVGGHQKEDR